MIFLLSLFYLVAWVQENLVVVGQMVDVRPYLMEHNYQKVEQMVVHSHLQKRHRDLNKDESIHEFLTFVILSGSIYLHGTVLHVHGMVVDLHHVLLHVENRHVLYIVDDQRHISNLGRYHRSVR